MNARTLVSVHGYAGDGHQIWDQIRVHESHKCPIVVLSPVDSPITRMGPHICRHAGKRAYVGQESLDRQVAQMRVLLEYPFDFYLMNDSDSICLSPKIPEYLYKTPATAWSNIVSDEMHKRPAGYTLPRLASQPPYFMSRPVLERIVERANNIVADPTTPFIDWWFIAAYHQAKVQYQGFPDGASCPTDPNSFPVMHDLVREHGRIFVHSIKTPEVLASLIAARDFYVRTHK